MAAGIGHRHPPQIDDPAGNLAVGGDPDRHRGKAQHQHRKQKIGGDVDIGPREEIHVAHGKGDEHIVAQQRRQRIAPGLAVGTRGWQQAAIDGDGLDAVGKQRRCRRLVVGGDQGAGGIEQRHQAAFRQVLHPQHEVEPLCIEAHDQGAVEGVCGIAQRQYGGQRRMAGARRIHALADEEAAAHLRLGPPRILAHVAIGRRQGGTDNPPLEVDACDVGEEREPAQGVSQRRAALRRAVAHFRLVGEGPQYLFGRGEDVLFVARCRTRGLYQAVPHVGDVAAHAVDALQHADDRNRGEGDNDSQREPKPQRPAAVTTLFACFVLRIRPAAQPAGQAGP